MTPRKIVAELDRFIVGQHNAKRAVAIALRNRWRRQQVPEDLRDEIAPKNIIMIGPTGVGKTEISRRLAKLSQAPFLKVEASKFTEVGYVGRDVESMVRDLVELAVDMVRAEQLEEAIHRRRTVLVGVEARGGRHDRAALGLRDLALRHDEDGGSDLHDAPALQRTRHVRREPHAVDEGAIRASQIGDRWPFAPDDHGVVPGYSRVVHADVRARRSPHGEPGTP